ncbi:MAG: HNH endonuclease [Solirubrobacteraceae bacterium]
MGRTIYNEDEVRAAVEGARSLSDALRALGLRVAGGNFGTLRRLIQRFDISTEHMDPNWARRGKMPEQVSKPLVDVLVAGSTYKRASLKRRLYEAGIKDRACEMCGQGEEWMGNRMSLILDHINGVHDDHRLENLRIICPNCNATLDTHCGRKNKSGPRDCVYCGKEFHPKNSRQQYCSQRCGTRSAGPREPQPDRRKVMRPPYEQLMAELEATNYSAVARTYGVSDNAVRKWVRAYEWERSLEERAGLTAAEPATSPAGSAAAAPARATARRWR